MSDDPIRSALGGSSGSWIAFARVFVGVFWLYEVLIGGRWKLGLPGYGTNPEWVGFAAGADMVRLGERAIELGTWEWYAILSEAVVFPYAGLWSNVGTFVQVALALGLIFGFGVRPLLLVVIVQELLILPLGTVRISPLLVIGSVFAFGANAGHYYGLDGWIEAQGYTGLKGAILNPIAEMPLPSREYWPPIAAGFAILALYHVLAIGTMPEGRLELAAMEFAALLGVAAIGVAYAYKGADTVRLSADLVRLFVGYRVLHEIFVRTEPGINGLPGWAPAAEQAELFAEIATYHWASAGAFIEAVVIPYMGIWAAVFAVVNTALALGLLAGWRVREISALGLAFTGFLMALGFTRYAPFVFGYLFVTMAFGSTYLSLDAVAGRRVEPMAIGYYLVPVLAAGAFATGLIALTVGNVPGEYMTDLVGVVPTMLFVFAAMLAWVGFVQHGGRERLAFDLDRVRDGTV